MTMEQMQPMEQLPVRPPISEKVDPEKVDLERVKCAAILFQGELFFGLNHSLASRGLKEKYPRWKEMTDSPAESGFYTNTGRFVDRLEADEIAIAAQQVDADRLRERADGGLDSSEIKFADPTKESH